MGFPPTGISGFGCVYVSGRSLAPAPATGMIAFMNGFYFYNTWKDTVFWIKSGHCHIPGPVPTYHYCPQQILGELDQFDRRFVQLYHQSVPI